MKKKQLIALVTGCAGFVGSELCLFLLKNGWNVFGIDNLNDYYDINLKKYRLNKLVLNYKNFRFYNIDFCNKAKLKQLFVKIKNITCIFHIGARAGVRASIKDPYIYLKTNIEGTLNLLELMVDFSIKKIIFSSTSSVYAGEDIPFKESMCADKPVSTYAASKRSAEILLYTYHHLYNLDISIIRYFTVYGPYSRPDMALFKFIKNIDNKCAIDIYGDGSQKRDFTFIGDIVTGTFLAKKKIRYEIFNLGGGNNPIKLTKMIQLLEYFLQKNAICRYFKFIKADMKKTSACNIKAKYHLEWNCLINFELGIKITIYDYIKYKDFYKKMKI